MKVDRSNLSIYDRDRVKQELCPGGWRRPRVVFDRNRSLLMTEVPMADMSFV